MQFKIKSSHLTSLQCSHWKTAVVLGKVFFPRILETDRLLSASLIVSIFLSIDWLLESLCILFHCRFQEKVEKGTKSHESQHSVSWNLPMDFSFLLKSEKAVSYKHNFIRKIFSKLSSIRIYMYISCKFGMHFVIWNFAIFPWK